MNNLYFAPGACSFVPHVALETIKAATGQDYETTMLKLHKGEQKSPEYLKLNPDGIVPTLVAGGQAIPQIMAICDYLDRQAPQAKLAPTDPAMRTRATTMLAWMNNTVHSTFTHIFMPQKFADDAAAQAAMKTFNTAKYREYLERIQAAIAEAQAAGRAHLFGDSPTFADTYAIVFLRWGGIAGIDPESLPTYYAYVKSLAALPPYAAAIARERIELNTFKKA
jgi:glutathione S-transferase